MKMRQRLDVKNEKNACKGKKQTENFKYFNYDFLNESYFL